LVEKDKNVVHPIDVGIAGQSDVVVVADNLADVLASTSTEGTVPKVYRRFQGQRLSRQEMSIAVTNGGRVILGTDGDKGIYLFSGKGESASGGPILPDPGGVAADPKSLKWAVTQPPDQIFVMEGEELVKKLQLPQGRSMYRQGLLSFSPCGSLCVSARDRDQPVGKPWLLMYDLDEDEVRSLFRWTRETMTDFVVGPRMLWDRQSPDDHKSIY
jgi:hypothetical protein